MNNSFSYLSGYTFYLALLISVIGCQNDDAQQRFEDEAFQAAQDYTPMTIDGRINGEVDEDDWRISPRYSGLVRFYSDEDVRYPYPNPVATDQKVTFELYISLDAVDGFVVGGYNQRDEFVPLYSKYNSLNGLITFRINPTNIAQLGGDQAVGLHRIYLFDSTDNLITYGDIKIE